MAAEVAAAKRSKTCRDCGQVKYLDQFYSTARTRDGHRGDCKKCMTERGKQNYHRRKAAVRVRERDCVHPVADMTELNVILMP